MNRWPKKMKNKVLIVEDEVLIGMMLRKKLIARGYDVYDVLPTGEQAVAVTADIHADMILMDICLAGELNGIEAARQIKQEKDIPVIFFTVNNKDRNIIEQSKDVNPVAIIDKLGSIDDLYRAMDSALPRN